MATTIGAWLDGSRFPQQVDALVKVVEQLRAAAAAEGFEPAASEAHVLDPLWWRDQHSAVARHRADTVRAGVQRAQAEAALGEHRIATAVGRAIDQLDPFDLEVHHSVDATPGQWFQGSRTLRYDDYDPIVGAARSKGLSSLPALTPYIPRAHDEDLRGLVLRGVTGHSGMAMLVGSSSCGKTRACWEAVQLLGEGWRLWHPFDPTRPESALADIQKVGPRTVVWLNEAQHYLLPSTGALGERVAAGLRALLQDQARRPVLVLGTIWPEYWDTLTALPKPQSPDAHEQARKLLAGTNISVPSTFSKADMVTLRRDSARDPRLLYAAQRAADGQVTQYLAGAPSLLERYRNAPPPARAVLEAAMDARRLGAGLALPHPLLVAAAPGYLTDQEWDQASDDWFEEALAYASQPCHGARGALTRIRPRPGQAAVDPPHYRLADYLEQHGRETRYRKPVPQALWEAAFQHAHPEDLFALGRSARALGQPADHLRFALKAAEIGDHAAAWEAAEILHSAGRLTDALTMYQRAAEGSAYATARRRAAGLLKQLGRLDEAVQEYQAAAAQGHLPSVSTVVDLMLRQDQSGAAAVWVKQLAEQTDLDLLDTAITLLQHTGQDAGIIPWMRGLAEQHRPGALGRAVDLMQQDDQVEEAVTWLMFLANHEYLGAELLVADVLEETGRVEEATEWYQRAADSGYPSARSALARLSLPRSAPGEMHPG
ncbi:tetratricopeptide repeat protein [Streptomyces sp. AM8-1-1]|uniref:tetratricopeptide repeat protein n=1 Tax=Streptomyces sp. AM8-1-1 TaxID=3075825 RepID=UPI0028C3B75C|nr:tetratricopeptide repeat protein [Streptomyces sp. AM8-1-1]WNO70151.1 tetratricopeptide repeat protein [Streptomyces sp. AM8-1-1]WNO76965.1 tetratricopeptide repeat protein [Streptomyces sp. AM8-1-1]